MTDHLQELRTALAALPPEGRHGLLQGLANHARIAGFSEDQFFREVRNCPNGSTIEKKQLRDAWKTACRDLQPKASLPAEYTPPPRPEPPPEPKVEIELKPTTEADIIDLSPVPVPPLHQDQTIQFLDVAFKPDEQVFIGSTYDQSVKQIEAWPRGEIKGPLYICNPLGKPGAKTKDGKPSKRSDDAVTDYRHLVIEFDEMPPDKQLEICRWFIESGSVVSVVFSGGKSYHILLRVGATDAEEYGLIKKDLVPYLKVIGADPACFNPARLTRMPGCRERNRQHQRLIYLNDKAKADVEGLLKRFKEVEIVEGGEPDSEEDEEKLDSLFPKELAETLPPALREIVDLLEGCSQTPRDIISLFLPVFSLPFLAGTVLKPVEETNGRPPRLLVTVIGPSGSGKTTPLERLRFLYRDLEQTVTEENKERLARFRKKEAKLKKEKDPDQIAKLKGELDENKPRHKLYQSQTGTRQGLCRAFQEGSHPLIILDEIGAFIRRADKGGPEQDNMSCITELADQGTIRPPLLKGNGETGPTETIYDISFSLYGTTTKEDLPQKKAANLLKGGFFARQMIGVIDEVNPPPDKNYLTTEEENALIKWRNQVMRACREIGFEFVLDDTARQVLKEYKERVGKAYTIAGNSFEHDAGMEIRRIKQAEDMALLFHACDPETNGNRYVSGVTVTMATLFVDYVHKVHHKRFLYFVKEGEEKANRKAIGDRILDYLMRRGGRLTLRQLYSGLRIRATVAEEVVKDLASGKFVKYENNEVVIL